MSNPEPPPIIRTKRPWAGLSRGWIAAWIGVGMFAIGCVVVALLYARALQRGKIEAADEQVKQAIEAADQWMAEDRLEGFAEVELSLQEAKNDEHASDPQMAAMVLKQVQAHRTRLEELKKITVAKKEADELFANAWDMIERQNGKVAMVLLKQYLRLEHATKKAEAQSLQRELSVSTSDSAVLRRLMDLNDDDFSRVESSRSIREPRVERPELQAILDQTVRRNLPEAAKRREANRIEQQRIAEEKARKERLMLQARKERIKAEQAGKLEAAKRLAGLVKDPTKLESFLFVGDYTNAELEFQSLLVADPANDNLRFQLALTQFFRSVERLGQSLHQFGLRNAIDDVPFVRLPVPKNPSPSQVRYMDFRRTLDDFVRDLDAVDATLAAIKDRDTAVSLRLGIVRFDMNGDGKAMQDLNTILKKLHKDEFAFLKKDEALKVDFDRGDVSWLRIYCQLMSVVLDLVMAFDFEPVFNDGAAKLFETPNIGKRQAATEKLVRIVEPKRLDRVRRRLILITELNEEMWVHVRLEKDNQREWLPNSNQRSVLGFTVNDRLVDSWLGAMREVGLALKGERVVPGGWVGARDDKGLNLKNVLQNPPLIIDEPLVQGFPDSLPDEYFTKGDDFQVLTFWILWRNYSEWFGDR